MAAKRRVKGPDKTGERGPAIRWTLKFKTQPRQGEWEQWMSENGEGSLHPGETIYDRLKACVLSMQRHMEAIKTPVLGIQFEVKRIDNEPTP